MMTRANIEALAQNILIDYYGDMPKTPEQVKSTDIEMMAEKYLNLRIAYTRLSDHGNILGLTTYADVEIMLERFRGCQTIEVAKNTILVDDSLYPMTFMPDKDLGRRRFTIAHECAHQIFFRAAPSHKQDDLREQYANRLYSLRELKTKDDWCEWGANALGAALLMPSTSIALIMKTYKHGHPIVSYENRYCKTDKQALKMLAWHMKVSKSAMLIRLKQLGYVISKPADEFRDPLEIRPYEDEEYMADRNKNARNTGKNSKR